MNYKLTILAASILLCCSSLSFAQTDDAAEDLKIAAIEALMTAPPERALPIVTKVLRGDGSNDLKEPALFVLSQMRTAEAEALLLEFARTSDDDLQEEAVRMIGINGSKSAMANLADLYKDGDENLREAVLEAYMIAHDEDAVFAIAEGTNDPDEFESAVEMLGAMRATEKLRLLRNRAGMSEALIEAYAIAGDVETLQELASDGSDGERQAEAIKGMAIAGRRQDNPVFLEIYRNADNDEIREAVREALLISNYDEGALELFREAQDAGEKRELLDLLVMMKSDAVWDIIDSTLENE